MKHRLLVIAVTLSALVAACGSGDFAVAKVGDVEITDDDVRALNLPDFPPSDDEYVFELQFLISSQLYADAAERDYGVTVADADVAAYIASPPPHVAADLAQFQGLGRFSDAGIDAQVERWVLSDRVVEVLIADETELAAAIAESNGVTAQEVIDAPLRWLTVDEARQLFNSWTTRLANEGGLAEVTVSPSIGSWDPVFRQLIPADA